MQPIIGGIFITYRHDDDLLNKKYQVIFFDTAFCHSHTYGSGILDFDLLCSLLFLFKIDAFEKIFGKLQSLKSCFYNNNFFKRRGSFLTVSKYDSIIAIYIPRI